MHLHCVHFFILPLLLHVLHLLVSIVACLPFSSRPSLPWLGPLFCLPCRFSKPLQCAKCSTHSSSEFALNGFSQSGHLTILALLSTVSVSMALVSNRFSPPSLGVKVLACLLIPVLDYSKKQSLHID